ncbi:unnamed protein product, partial [Urochloa humidicola]
GVLIRSLVFLSSSARDPECHTGGTGKIQAHGKLQLQKVMKDVNQVWQIESSVAGGTPAAAVPRQARPR